MIVESVVVYSKELKTCLADYCRTFFAVPFKQPSFSITKNRTKSTTFLAGVQINKNRRLCMRFLPYVINRVE